jgi:Ribbon-helix-helix protein, copG family
VADLLVRDVPDDVLAAIDEKARRLGLSRAEYLRRVLTRERTTSEDVTGSDLRRFAVTFADLGNPEIMRRAWE